MGDATSEGSFDFELYEKVRQDPRFNPRVFVVEGERRGIGALSDGSGIGKPSDEYARLLGLSVYLYSALLSRFVDGIALLCRQGAAGALSHEQPASVDNFEGRVSFIETAWKVAFLVQETLYESGASGKKLKRNIGTLKQRLCKEFPDLEPSAFAELAAYLDKAAPIFALDERYAGITATRNIIAHSSPVFSPFNGCVLRRQYVDGVNKDVPPESKFFHKYVSLQYLQDYVAALEAARDELFVIEKGVSVTSWAPGMDTLYDVLFVEELDKDEILREYQALPPLDVGDDDD